jgi:transcriptional regulator with GAF, ATPase, and Fis domain
MAAPPEVIGGAIEDALEQVRVFFGADRCGLLSVSNDLQWVHVQHAAYGEGVEPVSREINLVELFPWARQRLFVEQAPVVVHRLEDLPPDASRDGEVWRQMAVRSNLAVPIRAGASVASIMVIHWVREECRFPETYTPRLRVLGEMMANALQRKQAIEALVASEERLDRASAAAGCGLWDFDATTGDIWVTPLTRHIYGLSADQPATYQRFVALLHPDDRERVQASLSAALADGVLFDEQYRIVLGDGTARWIRAIGRPDGSERLLGASLDVTEQVRAADGLRAALEEVQRLRDQLQSENVYLRQESRRHVTVGDVVGRSPAIRRALELAQQVAPTNATVLLTGETGTGKERFATLIHEASPRRARVMVRVNCSAIPTALIESELFGREKGAYTGALSKQVGRFEVADGSTLFLDEVGDLPMDVQVKLLRVLQERTIERLGSPRPITVDVRIVAATNGDLEQAVREGRFRSDLFYRLNVFPIDVPALRDRREDIPALVAALVEEIGAAMGKRFDAVAKSSLDALQRYDWPGNVRELRNVLERAMILSPGPTLWVEPPGPAGPPPGPPTGPGPEPPGTLAGSLQDVERDHILRVLAETGWRIKGPGSASVRLALKPSTLYFRMKKLGITKPQ